MVFAVEVGGKLENRLGRGPTRADDCVRQVWAQLSEAGALRPGDVVVLDNLAVHKRAEARELIERDEPDLLILLKEYHKYLLRRIAVLVGI